MAREDQYVDEVEESGSEGLSLALVVITTLALIAACILVELALKGYGAGMLK